MGCGLWSGIYIGFLQSRKGIVVLYLISIFERSILLPGTRTRYYFQLALLDPDHQLYAAPSANKLLHALFWMSVRADLNEVKELIAHYEKGCQ